MLLDDSSKLVRPESPYIPFQKGDIGDFPKAPTSYPEAARIWGGSRLGIPSAMG